MTNHPGVAGRGASRKRILHVHKAGGIAGSERHLQLLLPRLDPNRFEVTLLLLTPRRWAVDEYLAPFGSSPVEVEQADIRADVDPRCFLHVCRLIKRGAFDLVHTHLIHADLYGGAAARIAGVRHLVSTRHNDDRFRLGAGRSLGRLVARNFDRVIVLSRYLATFVQSVEGVHPERVATIPYGLELSSRNGRSDAVREELKVPAGAPLIVAVGRLIRQKGHRYLLRAWPRIIAAHPNARLLIVGDGPHRRPLTDEARALGVLDSITFTGWRRDVPSLLEAADICAHPSLWEGFGLTLLEAMAAGTCIVASRVSSIPEVVLDGQTGLLVPAGDAEALAATILRLLEDPVRCRELGEEGRRRAIETFSAERMVRATEALYDELLT